jgi:hypothetical protein
MKASSSARYMHHYVQAEVLWVGNYVWLSPAALPVVQHVA